MTQMSLKTTLNRMTGVPWSKQGPALMICLGHGATHWVAATFYLLLPWIKDELQISYTSAGFLVAVFHFSSFIANFASGALTDISGHRVLIMSGSLFLGAAALGGTSLALSVLALAMMIAAIGASNNAWHPAALSFLSEHYFRNRGYALSLHALGANLGDALAPLIIGAILGYLNWKDTAFISTLPVFAVSLWLWMALNRNETDRPLDKQEMYSGRNYMKQLANILQNLPLLALSLLSGFRAACQVGLLMFVPIYLADILQSGPLITGIGFSMMQLGGVISSPMAGTFSDRIGRRPIVVTGLSLSTLVIIGLALAGSQFEFVIGITILGFVLYGGRPVDHAWALDLSSKSMEGTTTSLLFGMQSLFSITVPIITGTVADLWGVQLVFWVLAAIIMLSNLSFKRR